MDFTDLLDPREALSAPLDRAVWIPLSELPRRVNELPPKGASIRVGPTCEETQSAIRWLNENGWLARPEPSPSADTCGGVFRLWSPNPFLEEVIDTFPPGIGVDIACGGGRDAVFLAERGWQMLGIDHLPDSLQMAEVLRERYAPRARATWLQADLGRGLPVEVPPFSLATCFFFLDRRLLAEIAGRLEPEGSLLVETFTSIHRETMGKPRRLELVLQPDELPTLVPSLEVVRYEEGWLRGRHTARLHARRPA